MYSPDDSLKLYSISVLHACQPGVKDFELKESYENSFLSELHPGVALSRNTVSKFLNDLGKTCSRVTVFMRNRTASQGQDRPSSPRRRHAEVRRVPRELALRLLAEGADGPEKKDGADWKNRGVL